MRNVRNKSRAGRNCCNAAPALVLVGTVAAVFAMTATAAVIDKARLKKLREQPPPPVVSPGNPGTQTAAGRAPSDAVVLFDGTNLSKWIARGRSVPKGKDGAPAWKVQDGYMEVVPNSGNLISKEKFGDAQIHVEWSVPAGVSGTSQHRGNSGVYLLGHCEVQVLDSFENETYPDGHAGGIYHHYAPLVNPSLKPGEWQSFDLIYTAPRRGGGGANDKPASRALLTVLYNGIVVQNNVEIPGDDPEFNLMLQDHLNPVRFRNIWVRKLPPTH